MRSFLAFLLSCLLALSVALAGESVPDNRISADLAARLRRSKLAADGVRFSVKDGVVTWEGQVAIPQRKGAATRMAKAAGARVVQNRIRLGAGSSPSSANNANATSAKQPPVSTPKKFIVKYRPRAH